MMNIEVAPALIATCGHVEREEGRGKREKERWKRNEG
jgi:hypothetical protein